MMIAGHRHITHCRMGSTPLKRTPWCNTNVRAPWETRLMRLGKSSPLLQVAVTVLPAKQAAQPSPNLLTVSRSSRSGEAQNRYSLRFISVAEIKSKPVSNWSCFLRPSLLTSQMLRARYLLWTPFPLALNIATFNI